MKRFLTAFITTLFLTTSVFAFTTTAEFVHVVDYQTGAILLSKNADQKMFPSSMAKLMTAYVVFGKLKAGSLSLTDELPVSEKAWRMGGSKMFVEVGKKIKVEDLIRGMIIQSGNDACITLAEGIAGTEEAFAGMMNEKAKEMGMKNSHFTNSTGWPDPELYTTSEDLSILAKHLISEFPEYYRFYSETDFLFNGIKQSNRNPLLYANIGADGLKTGHTDIAGYGLTGSAIQNGRRLIMVVNGFKTIKDRTEEAPLILDWAFRNFENIKIFSAGQEVDNAKVWLGESATVPLKIESDIQMTVAKSEKKDLVTKVELMEPVPAPIKAGDKIARLIINTGDGNPMTYDLVAAKDVNKLGPVSRLRAVISHVLWGK